MKWEKTILKKLISENQTKANSIDKRTQQKTSTSTSRLTRYLKRGKTLWLNWQQSAYAIRSSITKELSLLAQIDHSLDLFIASILCLLTMAKPA